MAFYKILQYDERFEENIPVPETIAFLETLKRVCRTSSKHHVNEQVITGWMLSRPSRRMLEMTFTAPEKEASDVVDCLDIDGLLLTLGECQTPYISAGTVISMFARRTEASFQPAAPDPLAEALAGLIEDLPLATAEGPSLQPQQKLGSPIPAGGSRGDPLTEQAARNLYALVTELNLAAHAGWKAAQERREIKEVALPDMRALETRLMDRALYLLTLFGHVIRQRIPHLGYDCLPLSNTLMGYDGLLLDLYTKITRRNTSIFFRYVPLFEKFQKLFLYKLKQLAHYRKLHPEENKKIRILCLGVGSGEEAITVALLCALAIKANARSLRVKPGQSATEKLSDWVEIVGTECASEIRDLFRSGKYPNKFKDEIPPSYLNLCRQHGFIIEGETHFSFSPEVLEAITVHLVDLFKWETENSPAFDASRGPFDFFFNLHVFEYLMTDAATAEEADCASTFMQALDSGRLLCEGGYLFTEPNELRAYWGHWEEGDLMLDLRQSLQQALGALASTLESYVAGGLTETAANDQLRAIRNGAAAFSIHQQRRQIKPSMLRPYSFEENDSCPYQPKPPRTRFPKTKPEDAAPAEWVAFRYTGIPTTKLGDLRAGLEKLTIYRDLLIRVIEAGIWREVPSELDGRERNIGDELRICREQIDRLKAAIKRCPREEE